MNKQKIIDIMFEVAMKIHNDPWFKDKTVMEVAEWIRKMYGECGLELIPMGMSHGVIDDAAIKTT